MEELEKYAPSNFTEHFKQACTNQFGSEVAQVLVALKAFAQILNQWSLNIEMHRKTKMNFYLEHYYCPRIEDAVLLNTNNADQ